MAKRDLPQPIVIANKHLKKFSGLSELLRKQSGSDWWKLRNDSNSYITGDGKEGQLVIWPFPVKEELQPLLSSYPFFFSISISLAPNEDIREVNIKVFKEDSTLPSKADIKPTELLIRAEWSNIYNDYHAQPHWHIHSYTLIDQISSFQPEKQKLILSLMETEMQEETLASLMEEVEAPVEGNNQTVQTGITKKELPMYKFHLSMLADWDKEICKTQCKELNAKSLDVWLPQCLNYMKIQLEYLLENLPRLA
ncbi:MAG: hypothetical protein JNK91_01240 [Ferruginibacter sp.]|nr:hypothetical protein [Ferruginibacter sp.]